MKDVIVIGDVRGSDKWKDIADILLLMSKRNVTPKHSFYIFLGNYTCGYSPYNKKSYETIEDIVRFKRMYPDHVKLLLSGEDLKYYLGEEDLMKHNIRIGIAIDFFTRNRLRKVFHTNKYLFDIAFQHGLNLFTYSIVDNNWWKDEFLRDLGNTMYPKMDKANTAAKLNAGLFYSLNAIFNKYDYFVGGDTTAHASPLFSTGGKPENSLFYMRCIVAKRACEKSTTYINDNLSSVTYVNRYKDEVSHKIIKL